MKAGSLVPDATILRLITSELTTRGWLKSAASEGTVTLNSFAAPLSSVGTFAATVQGEDNYLTQNAVANDAFQSSDSPDASFILDGFPRTETQAVQLDELIPINLVVHIKTPVEVILDRICNRWVHGPSGRVYNTTFNAPKVAGKDDVTGEALTQRDDDCPKTWRARLQGFEKTSESLLEHYDRMGVLWTVNGNSSDEITPKLFDEFVKRFGV